jgi:ferredoxin
MYPIVTVTTRDGEVRRLDATEGTSVMAVLREAEVDDEIGLCGGCCSCATCHVYVDDAASDRATGRRQRRQTYRAGGRGPCGRSTRQRTHCCGRRIPSTRALKPHLAEEVEAFQLADDPPTTAAFTPLNATSASWLSQPRLSHNRGGAR